MSCLHADTGVWIKGRGQGVVQTGGLHGFLELGNKKAGVKSAELGVVSLSNANIVVGTARAATLTVTGQRVVGFFWKSMGGLPGQAGTPPVFIITFSRYQS